MGQGRAPRGHRGRLRDKDGKTLQAGPFSDYVVVLHTDEAMLTHFEANEWLREYTFSGMRQTTEAYLLFSYDPQPRAIRTFASTSPDEGPPARGSTH